MKKIENDLVSIIIISYNSSKYIIETLESAKFQTYKNLELIVSDDCSTDNTIDIVNQWFEENKQRFVSGKVIKADKNIGISGNCNRGINNSKGSYIKLIAGDDLLTSNCINDYIEFFKSDDNIQIAASQTKIFYNNDLNNFQIWPQKGQFPTGLKKQKKEILKANFVYNVSIFFKKDLFDTVGGFDENYPMIDDYPFDYKVLMKDIEFYFLNKITVNYRVNFDSTTRPASQMKFVNVRSHNEGYIFMKREILRQLLKKKMIIWWFLRYSKLWVVNKIIKNGNSSLKSENWLLHKLLFIIKYTSNKLRVFENKYL